MINPSKPFVRILTCVIIAFLSLQPANAEKKPRIKGANGLQFGWTLEKCSESIGDVPRKMTTGAPDDTQRQFSYAPARYGALDWDGSVLDFNNNKLEQIGFYKTTENDSRATFDTAKEHLIALFGQPVEVQQTDNNLLWTGAKGNMALLQYARENDAKGNVSFTTYLMFLDNKRIIKKARKAESFLKELMKD